MVVSNIFYFHPYLGKIPILTNIFQMGWFNHQLGKGFSFWFSDFRDQKGLIILVLVDFCLSGANRHEHF